MINNVAKDILEQINSIHWLDTYAGIVKTVSKEYQENGVPVVKRFPVSCEATTSDCFSNGTYKDLVPDSSKKSILYFEEVGGAQLISKERDVFNYQTTLRMVCWLNQKLLGTEDCSISDKAICDIMNAMNFKRHNNVPLNLQKINIRFATQEAKTANIFAAYNYQEEKSQYLMYPFDYFALNFVVQFSINKNCCEGIPELPANECNVA